MHGLAWILDQVDHEEGLRATGAMQLEALCKHVLEVAQRRLPGGEFGDLRLVVGEVRSLMRRRNEFVHSHWVEGEGGLWTMLRIRAFRVETVSLREIQDCNAAIKVAELRVFDIARRLAGGWLPAFILETQRLLAYEGKTITDLVDEALKWVAGRNESSPTDSNSA